MQVAISEPSVAFAAGTAPTGRARALFDALQDRHVPITPKLASHLAECDGDRPPALAPVWGAGFARAGEALELSGAIGHRASWTSVFDVYIRTVAEPVLRRAAALEGLHLVTTGPVEDKAEMSGGYSDYRQRLEAQVTRLLSDPAAMPDGFWSFSGASLLSAFRTRAAMQKNRKRDAQAVLFPARPDPLTTRILFDVEPKFGPDAGPKIRRLQTKVRSKRDRSGSRPREGGVTGVDYSKRLEDIGDALPSTFLTPPKLLPLKITEEGFTITRRPPHRHPARDLLSMTFNDLPLSQGPATILKAAWADAAIRLRHILAGMEQKRCELGWCDMTELGPVPAAMTVEDIETDFIPNPLEVPDKLRLRLLSQIQQFPELLSVYPNERTQRATARSDAAESAEIHKMPRDARRGMEAAVKAAILGGPKHQASRSQHAKGRSQASETTRIEDYAVVFAVRVSPTPISPSRSEEVENRQWRDDLRDIRSAFKLHDLPRVVTGSAYLPPRLDAAKDGDDACFLLVSERDGRPVRIELDPQLETDKAVERLVGDLSIWFITETLEALHVS